MLIQVHTDNHIQGSEKLTNYVQSVIQDSLARFAERVTRVEVHLHDNNSHAKSSDNDKHCGIEVRISGLEPMNVSHQAGDIDHAIDGATEKMVTLLDRHLGKLSHTKGRVSHAGPQE
jgi:ribosome-associated translation inhibitor RaiA